MTDIHIIADIGRIILQVHAYERTHAENTEDANWLTCTVEIDVPPFSARYPAAFSTEDFQQFADEVRAMCQCMEGNATFEPAEMALIVRMSMRRGSGDVSLECRALSEGPPRAELAFSLRADQSRLFELRRELDAVRCEFPKRV